MKFSSISGLGHHVQTYLQDTWRSVKMKLLSLEISCHLNLGKVKNADYQQP